MKLGLYQHYKGDFYQVLGICRHTETGEACVVYQALSGDYGLWARPQAMFEESIEMDGKLQLRFKFIRELLEKPPVFC